MKSNGSIIQSLCFGCINRELNAQLFDLCLPLSVALQDTCWWRMPQADTAFIPHALRDLVTMAHASLSLQASSDATVQMATLDVTVKSP